MEGVSVLDLDAPPIGFIYRTIIGVGMIPAWSRVRSLEWGEWTLLPFLLFTLLILRIVPTIVRLLVPFPKTLRTEWAQRRELGKRFDSYQWRKVFWIGLGMAIYIVVWGDIDRIPVLLTGGSLISGTLGLVVWRRVGTTNV